MLVVDREGRFSVGKLDEIGDARKPESVGVEAQRRFFAKAMIDEFILGIYKLMTDLTTGRQIIVYEYTFDMDERILTLAVKKMTERRNRYDFGFEPFLDT